MNSTQRPRPPRRASEPHPPVYLGVILVVVAVAFGAILLVKGGGIGFEDDAKDVKIETGAKDEAPTTTAPTETSSPATSVPAAELKIAVLNGAGKNGFAAAGVTFLSVAGYPNATPGNSVSQVTSTGVYFAPGFEADAKSVAALLSIGEVKPMPAEPLGKSATDVGEGTGVVVVLGPDVEGIISATKTDGSGTGSGTTSGTSSGTGATTDTTGSGTTADAGDSGT
ncbi:MAG: LytR C-terminal domain-containing protein [Microthrixaceae bacterium]